MGADGPYLRVLRGSRLWAHRYSTRLYGRSRTTTALSWIGDERVAVGGLPTAAALKALPPAGVTHVVNCRARLQTAISQDLFAERVVFGASRVVHAPLWDFGQSQPAALWSPAVLFAAAALNDDPGARVLIHCHQGRRRSVMVAYAVLRLRGHSADDAERLILTHRREAELVPAYRASVEQWLADCGPQTPA